MKESFLMRSLPGLIWLAYFYITRENRSQPFDRVLKVFMYGCASTIPAIWVQQVLCRGLFLANPAEATAQTLLVIGPSEELVKLMAVWLGVYRSHDFRRPIDGMVYSTTAALGFASIENIITMGVVGSWVLLGRAVIANPAHVILSSIWGYAMGMARYKRTKGFFIILAGFLAAAILHGAYDLILILSGGFAIIVLLPLMAFMGVLMVMGIRKLRALHPFPTPDGGDCTWNR